MTSDCKFRPRLGPYHDGELPLTEAEAVQRHLETCRSCAAEMAVLRNVTVLFDEFANQPLDGKAVARFHEEFDAATAPAGSVLRIGGLLTALAASVLIIGSAWLMEAPVPSTAHPLIVHGDSAPWERVAMTLRADPLPGDGPGTPGHDSAYADADLADWILRNLSDRTANANN